MANCNLDYEYIYERSIIMSINFFKGETFIRQQDNSDSVMTNDEINLKYKRGEARLVVEQGTIKLNRMVDIFNTNEYNLTPDNHRHMKRCTR